MNVIDISCMEHNIANRQRVGWESGKVVGWESWNNAPWGKWWSLTKAYVEWKRTLKQSSAVKRKRYSAKEHSNLPILGGIAIMSRLRPDRSS